MRHEKTPVLKKYITLPLILSPDRDEELVKLTEHRVATFSHDLIPNYLRTRPEPEIENKYMGIENRANGCSQVSLVILSQLLSEVCSVYDFF